MRKLVLLVAVIAAMTALTALTVTASADPTAEPDGTAIQDYRICNGPAILRSAPEASGGWRGEMSDGQVFGVIANSYNNFDYGYAYGNNHIYAYMNRNYECK